MKSLQSILKKKKISPVKGEIKSLDEKTIIGVFLSVAKSEIENLETQDIPDIKLKEKTLYIKTAHPVVSSELFLRKAKILEEANKIAGKKVIEKIII